MIPVEATRLSGLATAAELAVIFTEYSAFSRRGKRAVSVRLVCSWHEQRASTGMPDPVPERRRSSSGPAQRQWDTTAALSWFLSWETGKPGAPRGNRNAVRHGRYVGLRAARAARAGQRVESAESLDP